MDLSETPAQKFFQDSWLGFYAKPAYPAHHDHHHHPTDLSADKTSRRRSIDNSVTCRTKSPHSPKMLSNFDGSPKPSTAQHQSLIIPHSWTFHQLQSASLVRPNSSCPNLTRTLLDTQMKSPMEDIVAEFQREKMEKLKKTGDLIDLGIPSTINGQKIDPHFFDPLLRPFSESSESSSGGSPFVNEGNLHNWETFDDTEVSFVSRRISQEITDESLAAEPLSGKAVALSTPSLDISQDRRSPRPMFNVENQKLAVLQVKAECESLRSFYRMVYRLHNDFQYDDELTNIGFIRSPMVEEFQRSLTGSVQLIVLHKASESVTTFDCDVQTTVEHAISHVLFEIKGDQASLMQMNRYIFRIHGRMDCLSGESPLSDYQQVHLSCKNSVPLKVCSLFIIMIIVFDDHYIII